MPVLYLVTGAAGHLGGAIVRLLQREGKRVRGLILPGERAPQGCACTVGDVRDVRSLQASDRPSPREIGVLPDAPCPCARWWAASTSGRERLPCSAAFAPSSPRGRSSTRARAF